MTSLNRTLMLLLVAWWLCRTLSNTEINNNTILIQLLNTSDNVYKGTSGTLYQRWFVLCLLFNKVHCISKK